MSGSRSAQRDEQQREEEAAEREPADAEAEDERRASARIVFSARNCCTLSRFTPAAASRLSSWSDCTLGVRRSAMRLSIGTTVSTNPGRFSIGGCDCCCTVA